MTDLWTKLAKISDMDVGEIKSAIGKMPYGDVNTITAIQDSDDKNDHRWITFMLKKYRDAPLSEWQVDGDYPFAFTALDPLHISEVFQSLGVKYHKSGDDFYVRDWQIVESIVKKNPITRDMAVNGGKYRPKVTPSRKEKEEKKDPWNRGAKRKDKKMDELNEGVTGMSGMPTINRMRKLAGLPGVADMDEPLPTEDMADGLPMDDIPVNDIQHDDVELPEIRPMVSDAMTEIQSSINSIQRRLSDIRMAEYKTLVKKLDDLQVQVRAMGADYLGGE